ncbi:MAG: hypothetical protein HQM09_25150 [Candidatus Riflebacteria bacterium]|nr:hypothetical protein [Candidatus Riflebacteria bacterium]
MQNVRFFSMAFLFAILLFAAPISACDVNLVSLITGENPNDAFSQMIIKLASETRSVGQALPTPDLAAQNMKQLMKTWVEFDNRFSQTPPEWGKGDTDWSKKIKSIADFIGRIESDLRAGKNENIHSDILSLSERIFKLLDAMPMSEQQRVLIRIFYHFVKFSEARETSDGSKFSENLKELVTDFSSFQKIVATDSVSLTKDLEFEISQLTQMYKMEGASLTVKVQSRYLAAETSFKKMTENLRKNSK